MATQNGDDKDNVFNGGYLADMYFAMGGMDTISGGWGDDSLFGGTGNDTLNGDQNDDFLSGDEGNDTLNGGTGRDTLFGGTGADKMNGGAGDDYVMITSFADMASDIIDGGSGVDTLSLSFNTLTTAITFSGKDPILVNTLGTAKITGIEQYQISGGSGADKLTGYLLSDTLSGGKGTDTLRGLDGFDFLQGGDANDLIYGGNDGDFLNGDAGNDTLNGDAGNDFAQGGSGADLVNGGNGDDTLHSHTFSYDGKGDLGVEIDSVNGGNGNDRVEVGMKDKANGGAHDDTIQLDLTASKVGENFTFSSGLITLASGGTIQNFEMLEFFGGAARDIVTGGDRDDGLNGGGGADVLSGALGNDRINGGLGADVVHGDAGNDAITDTGGADRSFGDAGDDVFYLSGFNTDADAFDGGTDKDTVIFWNSDSDEEVDDELSGFLDLTNQALNDGLLKGDTFKNIETFIGSDKDDFMFGSAGVNTFYGSEGDDVLDGRAGNDLLVGGEGSDTMTGGEGKDVFDLSDQGDGVAWFGDIITDFTQGQDKIQVSLEFLGIESAPELDLVVGNNPAPTGSGPQLLFDTATHRLWFDMDGAGTEHSGMLVATLEDVTKLAVTDFQFI